MHNYGKNPEKEFIRVENLHFKYRKKNVIEDITLGLKKEEFVSLIGPNGSGKTTLGKLITGILEFNKGKIFVDDRNIKELTLAYIGKKIGYLFQNPSMQIFAANVYDELQFAMRFNKVDKDTIQRKTEKILKEFDLEHLKESKCHTLSQGERQRLALGTIFLNDPKYLILDEPTTGLDKKRKEQLSQTLQDINAKGIGVLMISHDIDFVDKHSKRIIELRDGRIFKDERCGS
ncbi:ABC transporter ATP-binding protein [Clostridium sediminicola]|uniref:energy-coupling factor ABC transporter ATP-binding protein n=1 Tax=Clostridium sediminicola TaxID=3114879 RepID=UPI0031F21721